MKLLPSKFNEKIFQISVVRTGVSAYMDATPLAELSFLLLTQSS